MKVYVEIDLKRLTPGRKKTGEIDASIDVLENEIDGLVLWVDDSEYESTVTGIGVSVLNMQESKKFRGVHR